MSKNHTKRSQTLDSVKAEAPKGKGKGKNAQPANDPALAGLPDSDMDDVPAATPGKAANERLSPLARTYLASAIDSLTRVPSPNLKNLDFKATLLHWRAVILSCLGVAPNHPAALVTAIRAIGGSEGTLQAKRLIDNVQGQALWAASVDYDRAEYRDSRTALDVEYGMRERVGAYQNEEIRQDADTAPCGLDPERDPERETPPTAEEAREALFEVNAWLGMLADLLPADDEERLFLNLEHGLPYTRRPDGRVDKNGEATWEPVLDIDDAIEHQRQKNKESLSKRAAKRLESQKDTFAAIAKMAA